MKEYKGTFFGNEKKSNQKIAIVCSRFNEFITKSLLEGAIDCLQRHGVPEKNIEIFWVPGAFEIPLVIQKVLESKKEVEAVIALGAVIKGATAHFDFVSVPTSSHLQHLSLKYGKPVIFGILTTENIEQAIERAGTKLGNKGFEAALTALEMTSLLTLI